MNGAKVGQIFLRKRLISQKQLDFCLAVRGKNNGFKLGETLRHYNLVTDVDIAEAIAEQVSWQYFDEEYIPHMEAVEKLGIDFYVERKVFPASTSNGVKFVMDRFDDTDTTDIIIKKGYGDAEIAIGAEDMLCLALESLVRKKTIQEAKKNLQINISQDNVDDWFEEMLNRAIAHEATDIHIDPAERVTEIRNRVDGVLHFDACLKKELHYCLINIALVKAELPISDFMKFHDGKFLHKYLNREVDVRVSHVPSTHGPSIVLRLLDKRKTIVPLSALGYALEHRKLIDEALTLPYGIILATGPTGSGKTTTLYSILNHMKSLSSKIITIEDPVEIKLPLITQVQINVKQGITFENATRAFLRHDPDIMFIGEIRDSQTAEEAVRASITGHKVFSTLHTNTPLDALLRLQDLGVGLSYIINSLVCVISQRLVRKLCPVCKEKVSIRQDEAPESMKKYLKSGENVVYKPKGCEKCIEGYWGRTVVAEVLFIKNGIKTLIADNNINALREYLKEKDDYISLAKNAARLVWEGVTTLAEIVRVVG